EEQARTYLHQGIAARSFDRRFQLADHVQVQSANYENGLLHIDLQRIIPETMKPRTIPIGNDTAQEKLTQVAGSQAANTDNAQNTVAA
ncbi:MAG: Hsp20 family protein, partial [Moraxellaceae bacterium]